jgi:uncharacterized membrane protein
MDPRDDTPARDGPAYPDAQSWPDFESQPLSRGEYVTALVHLYRGELSRSLNWRARLDTTTNWAIIATLAVLTFGFNNPTYARETLIAGMYANLVFLLHEARRFRFFDLYRARLRMIEENFYGPLLRRDPHSPIDKWGVMVADDLLRPRFKITLLQAMRARLLRNYASVFVLLLLAWSARLFTQPPTAAATLLPTGPAWLLDWLPVALVAALYLFLAGVILFTPRPQPPEVAYWTDPRHPGEDVSSLDV